MPRKDGNASGRKRTRKQRIRRGKNRESWYALKENEGAAVKWRQR